MAIFYDGSSLRSFLSQKCCAVTSVPALRPTESPLSGRLLWLLIDVASRERRQRPANGIGVFRLGVKGSLSLMNSPSAAIDKYPCCPSEAKEREPGISDQQKSQLSRPVHRRRSRHTAKSRHDSNQESADESLHRSLHSRNRVNSIIHRWHNHKRRRQSNRSKCRTDRQILPSREFVTHPGRNEASKVQPRSGPRNPYAFLL